MTVPAEVARIAGELMLAYSLGVFSGGLVFWIALSMVRSRHAKMIPRLLPALLGVALAVVIGCVFIIVSRKTGHSIGL
jgi:uncharacterized membrane protein